MNKYVAAAIFTAIRIALTVALAALCGWLVTRGWEVNADISIAKLYIVVGSWFLMLGAWIHNLTIKFFEAADDYEDKVINKRFEEN